MPHLDLAATGNDGHDNFRTLAFGSGFDVIFGALVICRGPSKTAGVRAATGIPRCARLNLRRPAQTVLPNRTGDRASGGKTPDNGARNRRLTGLGIARAAIGMGDRIPRQPTSGGDELWH